MVWKTPSSSRFRSGNKRGLATPRPSRFPHNGGWTVHMVWENPLATRSALDLRLQAQPGLVSIGPGLPGSRTQTATFLRCHLAAGSAAGTTAVGLCGSSARPETGPKGPGTTQRPTESSARLAVRRPRLVGRGVGDRNALEGEAVGRPELLVLQLLRQLGDRAEQPERRSFVGLLGVVSPVHDDHGRRRKPSWQLTMRLELPGP